MYKDPFTGRYHTHYRDYDPVTNRWLSEDPAGYMDGLNLYGAYMGVNGRDPDGLATLTKAQFDMLGKAVGDRLAENGALIQSGKGTGYDYLASVFNPVTTDNSTYYIPDEQYLYLHNALGLGGDLSGVYNKASKRVSSRGKDYYGLIIAREKAAIDSKNQALYQGHLAAQRGETISAPRNGARAQFNRSMLLGSNIDPDSAMGDYMADVNDGIYAVAGFAEMGLAFKNILKSGNKIVKQKVLTSNEPVESLHGTIKDSFTNGHYDEIILDKDILTYRASDYVPDNSRVGDFFGTDKPLNSLDAEELYNIKLWGNNAHNLGVYKIKAGTKVFYGRVADGMGYQIYIPNAQKLLGNDVNLLRIDSLFINANKALTPR